MEYYALYVKYHGIGEKRRWTLEVDVPWAEIDPSLANKDLIELIKIASLVESFSYQNCARFFQAHRGLPWLIGWKTMNLYEENRHHYSLLRYAQAVGATIDDEEIAAIQRGYQESADLKDSQWSGADLLEELILAWISEIETAVWYRVAADHIGEPVGARLFNLISQDEWFHAAYYNEVIERMIAEEPAKRFQKVYGVIMKYQDDQAAGKDEHYGVVIGRDTFAKVRSKMVELGAAEQIKASVAAKLKVWKSLVPEPAVG
ncbi:MAG: acyl-ACP desaturase [Candidatus Sericytochromatia bacterium]|uniref:Acyl-ACP desaturase n=1 Tax=Candidatus Tanganyikabacteria bacterium TaxID=2961651 RepID=A0A937X1K4_9BACT|nr:acyl-ACP desaturase [Candidatus Tanganyikabacteria bacterium]